MRQAKAKASDNTVAPGVPAPRRWFRLIALVAIPFLLLAGTEGILRLIGFGYPAGFFLTRTIAGHPAVIDNREFGKRFFPSGLVRYPHSFVMPERKPTNGFRVFVLGESAAMGDPDPKFGLPRMLEVLLQARFPDRQVQVVNASMVAINSHAVLPIARDCARQQGDLWVVYMGNNEMIGPFGAISPFGAQVPALPLIRAGLAAKRLRLGQLVDRALQGLHKSPTHWQGMTMWGTHQVRHTDPQAARVHGYFRDNLERILEAGSQAGVPIILSTVATNLKDCAPFGSLHKPGLTAGQLADWQNAFDQGLHLETQGDWSGATASYERARAVDPEFAELSFRLGRCLIALGKTNDAALCFSAARNCDSLQFRADDEVNAIIRECAVGRAGVHLLDAAELVSAQSPERIAGQEFFYEHVHFNPEGNYLLARAVAEKAAVVAHLAPSAESTNGVGANNWLSLPACAQALGLTDWNRHQILSRVLSERVEQPPFTGQASHEHNLNALREQLERLRAATKPAQMQRALRQVADAVARRPNDLDLRWNYAQLLDLNADARQAEEQWRKLTELLPQASVPYYNLGRLIESQGRSAEAQRLYRQCLALEPNNLEARQALGSATL